MRIILYARFISPESGLEFDIVGAKNADLKFGERYEVEDLSMGQSFTYINLKGIDGAFNSVQFDFEEDGTPIDIYSSPKYNPYIRCLKDSF